jgi:hypothetical protein
LTIAGGVGRMVILWLERFALPTRQGPSLISIGFIPKHGSWQVPTLTEKVFLTVENRQSRALSVTRLKFRNWNLANANFVGKDISK